MQQHREAAPNNSHLQEGKQAGELEDHNHQIPGAVAQPITAAPLVNLPWHFFGSPRTRNFVNLGSRSLPTQRTDRPFISKNYPRPDSPSSYLPPHALSSFYSSGDRFGEGPGRGSFHPSG